MAENKKKIDHTVIYAIVHHFGNKKLRCKNVDTSKETDRAPAKEGF